MGTPHMELREAKAILQSRVSGFTGALYESIGKWNQLGPDHAIYTESTRGHIINDIWYSRAEQGLAGDAGVEFRNNASPHRKYILIDERLALRLKHVGADYRPRNYPTERSLAWQFQQRFPTIPDVPRLDLCYRLDLTGTLIDDAIIQYSRGSKTLWRWQVWGPPVTEFATSPVDLLGRDIFVHDDYSVVKP